MNSQELLGTLRNSLDPGTPKSSKELNTIQNKSRSTMPKAQLRGAPRKSKELPGAPMSSEELNRMQKDS